MNEALISFTGNCTNDVELRFTPSGHPVANVTVAVTPREKDGDTWKDGDAAFYRVTLWRQAGENLANSITKGDRVSVVGRLKPREYESQGRKGISLDVDADSVALDVRFKAARFAESAQREPAQRERRKPVEDVADPWATPAQTDEIPF
jgi:single-strand DNA-binding protein